MKVLQREHPVNYIGNILFCLEMEVLRQSAPDRVFRVTCQTRIDTSLHAHRQINHRGPSPLNGHTARTGSASPRKASADMHTLTSRMYVSQRIIMYKHIESINP